MGCTIYEVVVIIADNLTHLQTWVFMVHATHPYTISHIMGLYVVWVGNGTFQILKTKT